MKVTQQYFPVVLFILLYKVVLTFESVDNILKCDHSNESWSEAISDLPTSKTCKSGDFEKKPRKTWRLGPQTWRFPKYVLNENKNGRFLFQSILYLIYATYCILLPLSTRGTRLSLLFTASFPMDLSVPMFHGNEAGIVPRFPSNIKCDKFGHFQQGFFNIASYYLNCFQIHREIWRPNRETVS